MDVLTFVSKLVEFSAWPIAAVVLGIVLRNPLENLLKRLKEFKHKDTKASFSEEGQATPSVEKNSSITNVLPADSLGLLKDYEDLIYKSLDNMEVTSADERVKVLTRHHANLQIQSTYSQINNSIYQSQLSLLQALATQTEPVDLSFFTSYYEAAKTENAEHYKTYSFDKWLNYLKNAGLLNTNENKYILSKIARGFLIALSESGETPKRVY
jgi:hypothetical protein